MSEEDKRLAEILYDSANGEITQLVTMLMFHKKTINISLEDLQKAVDIFQKALTFQLAEIPNIVERKIKFIERIYGEKFKFWVKMGFIKKEG